MAYAQSGGLYDFFIPNVPFATTDAGVLKEVDIGAASGTAGEFICIKPCTVKRLGFMLSGEAASGTTTAPTVVFKKRPTPLSSSGQTTMGTLTIPSGTAIGKVVYKEIEVDLAVGDSIQVTWTIGVGTPTGMGFPFIEAFFDDEAPGNNSDMIVSA
jgi:hypothetical protein